mmetsp:Transcript_3929/g.13169  ORF Transcript_3929/g.13169 Transcript_3929/m.13169 type:complete len:207 (-) Transcript_3929:536-1156(-)
MTATDGPGTALPSPPRGPSARLAPLVGASGGQGHLEVAPVRPEVAGVLDPPDHRQRLVVGAHVGLAHVVVQHGGPHERAPFLGGHGEVEPREARAPALVHVGEVQEEGVHAGAPGGVHGRVLVVVHFVKLPGLVPQGLQVLRVVLGHPQDVQGPCLHRLHDRLPLARGHVAPRGGGGAHGGDPCPGEGPREIVPTGLKQGVRLLRA